MSSGLRRIVSTSRGYSTRATWDVADPIGHWRGASAHTDRKPAPTSNKWLLHPWLPVDVRLPAVVGVGATALYIYLDQTNSLGASTKQQASQVWQTGREVVGTIDGGVGWGLEQARSTAERAGLLKARPHAAKHPEETSHSIESDGGKIEAYGTDSTLDPTISDTEKPVAVDPRAISDLFQDALTGQAPPSHESTTDATSETGNAVKDSATEPQGAPSGPANTSELVEDLHRAAQGLDRSAGALSSRSTGSQVALAESKRALDPPMRERIGRGDTEEQILHTRGFMGLPDDISSSYLLAKAGSIGMGPTPAHLGAAYQQALADTECFKTVLQKVGEHHEANMAEARKGVEHWEAQARRSLEIAEATVGRTAQILEQQQLLAERKLQQALTSQELSLAVEHETQGNIERAERHAAIDDVRGEVNALAIALRARSEQLGESKRAHSIVAALSSLATTLARGGAIGPELSALQSAAVGEDEGFVAAVLRSLPSSAAEQGVPSLAQLQERWPTVQRSVRVKAALKQGGDPGLLSTALASFAASLKVSEQKYLTLKQPARTVDAQLAAIEDAVKEGHLREVVALLEELSNIVSSDRVADDFLSAVKARALAEQAVSALNAQASLLSTAAASGDGAV